MEHLVQVGAFDAVAGGRSRRQLLWELKAIEESLPKRRKTMAGDGDEPEGADAMAPAGTPSAGTGPPRGRGALAGRRLGDAAHQPRNPDGDPLPPLVELPASPPPLPVMDERTRVTMEYALTEVSTGPHMVSFMREQLHRLGCTPLADVRALADGTRIRVAGLVITRQAPMSARGFRFFTLADEDAHLDLVFRPAVVQRTREVARHPLLMIDGTLQVEHGRINVLVRAVTALDADGHPLPAGGASPPGTEPPAPPAHNFR
jgi:DNA polymerase III alpha subunit